MMFLLNQNHCLTTGKCVYFIKLLHVRPVATAYTKRRTVANVYLIISLPVQVLEFGVYIRERKYMTVILPF